MKPIRTEEDEATARQDLSSRRAAKSREPDDGGLEGVTSEPVLTR